MNTNTGAVYEGAEQIKAALARNEPIVEISEQVAELLRKGQRAMDADDRRRAKRKQAAESRRRNR